MEVLPLDKVIVVLVADVWFDAPSAAASGGAGTLGDLLVKGLKTPADRAAYLEARSAALAEGLDVEAFRTKQFDAWTGTGAKPDNTVLCNFRIQLSTSSQMVNHSAFMFGQTAQTNLGGGDAKKRRLEGRSRMGLELCDKFGSYVVGGWQVGNVLDTAASRGAMPQGSNLGVRTAPGSAALSVNVAIAWWSADRLARAFNNAGGTNIRPRYVPKPTATNKDDDGEGVAAVDAQADSREDFITRAFNQASMRLSQARVARQVAQTMVNSAKDDDAKRMAEEALDRAFLLIAARLEHYGACVDALNVVGGTDLAAAAEARARAAAVARYPTGAEAMAGDDGNEPNVSGRTVVPVTAGARKAAVARS